MDSRKANDPAAGRRTEKVPSEKLQTNVLQMMLAIVVLLAVIYYGTTALASQDAFWFWRGFADRPARIVLYQHGQRTEWRPGQPGFDQVANGVVDTLNQGTVRGSATGLSEGSLQDAYNQYTTLEVFFDHPVKLHANVNTGHPTQMLIPLAGRHAETNVVFLGSNGKYMSNGPLLHTLAPLQAALQTLGYQIS